MAMMSSLLVLTWRTELWWVYVLWVQWFHGKFSIFFFFWILGYPGIEHDWSKPFIFHGGYRGLCWTRIHYLPPRPEDGGSLHVSYICFQYFWRSIIVFPDVSGCIIKAHDSGICTRQQNMVLSMRSSQVISWKKHDAP